MRVTEPGLSNRTRVSAGRRVQSVARALQVLEGLADSGGQMTLAEVANRIDCAPSTALTVLATLADGDYVIVDDFDGRKTYRIGPRLLQLGLMTADGYDLRSIASPHLVRLATESNATAFIAIANRGQALYVGKELPPNLTGVGQATTGMIRPLHTSALGKALLATLYESDLKEYVRMFGLPSVTPQSISSLSELQKDLERARSLGYSVDFGEALLDVDCVGAPVRHLSGTPVAAVSISARSGSFQPEQVGPLVRQAAHRISAALGWPGSESELFSQTSGTHRMLGTRSSVVDG